MTSSKMMKRLEALERAAQVDLLLAWLGGLDRL
jgi:hypothetical protein